LYFLNVIAPSFFSSEINKAKEIVKKTYDNNVKKKDEELKKKDEELEKLGNSKNEELKKAKNQWSETKTNSSSSTLSPFLNTSAYVSQRCSTPQFILPPISLNPTSAKTILKKITYADGNSCDGNLMVDLSFFYLLLLIIDLLIFY
jgi:hypothetical protein